MFDMDPVDDPTHHHHHHLFPVDSMTRVKSTGCLAGVNHEPTAGISPLEKKQSSLQNLAAVANEEPVPLGNCEKKMISSSQNDTETVSDVAVVGRSSHVTADDSSRVDRMFAVDSCSETSLFDCMERTCTADKDLKSSTPVPVHLVKAKAIHSSASASSFDSAMR